jgi:hypothetical protein
MRIILCSFFHSISFFDVAKKHAKTKGKTIPNIKSHFEPITAMFPFGAAKYGTVFGTSVKSRVKQIIKFKLDAIIIFILLVFIDLW